MGDRAQVCMVDSNVWLYTHWGGSELIETLKRAIRRKERWNDEEYLARIIFSEMIKGDIKGETGFGIGNAKHGDVWLVCHVNVQEQTISVERAKWCDSGKGHEYWGELFSGTFEKFLDWKPQKEEVEE